MPTDDEKSERLLNGYGSTVYRQDVELIAYLSQVPGSRPRWHVVPGTPWTSAAERTIPAYDGTVSGVELAEAIESMARTDGLYVDPRTASPAERAAEVAMLVICARGGFDHGSEGPKTIAVIVRDMAKAIEQVLDTAARPHSDPKAKTG